MVTPWQNITPGDITALGPLDMNNGEDKIKIRFIYLKNNVCNYDK